MRTKAYAIYGEGWAFHGRGEFFDPMPLRRAKLYRSVKDAQNVVDEMVKRYCAAWEDESAPKYRVVEVEMTCDLSSR